MSRVIVASVLLLALAPPALSQNAVAPHPKLKELVTVTGELVRIGDLVDGAGTAADIAVFRAPDLGQTGTVPLARVAEALQKHEVNGLDTGELSEVIVTRTSRTIGSAQVRDRIARAIAGKFGFGQAADLAVTIDRDVRPMHVESTATAELTVTRLSVDPRNGRFDIAFDLPGSEVARRLPLRFSGSVAETVEAAVLVRSVVRGGVVRASDVVSERRPRTEVGADALDVRQAVGLSARRPLRAGQALRQADLIKPLVVQRNEPVTIAFETPGIMLTVRGKAQEAGAVGDVIGVLNTQSNRTLQATIAGHGRVVIAAAVPRFAAVAVPTAEQPAAPKSAE